MDPITPYLDVEKCGGDYKVVEKRCYSRAWHQERNQKIAQGLNQEQAKHSAGVFAKHHTDRWKLAVGLKSNFGSID
jgi:hypothetical protein